MENFEEKDGRLNDPAGWRKPLKTNVTTTISDNVWRIAKQNNIAWNDALEFGILFLNSDVDGFDYPSCNLLKKLHKTVEHRNALLQEVDALRKQINNNLDEEEPEPKNDPEKDADELFGGLQK